MRYRTLETQLQTFQYWDSFTVTCSLGRKVSEHFYCHQCQRLPQFTQLWCNFQDGVLLPNYSEEYVVRGENVPNFKINTSEGTSSNVFQILQDIYLKQYQEQCHLNTVPYSTTNTVQNMAQLTTSLRTTTPSTDMTGTKMTTKQVNPVHVHPDTSCKAPLGHCTHVHQPTVLVCKPGELLALRKVKHPHNGRTSVNRLPLTRQDMLSQYCSCFEGIGSFPGDPYKFHLKLEHKPA